jgi:hypothetical protein
MTENEAIKRVTDYVANSLGYEYYRDEAKAWLTADAMTLLTGLTWTVLKDEMEGQYWVSKL